MNDDMTRLCEAVADEMLNPRSNSVVEGIVRAVLIELRTIYSERRDDDVPDFVASFLIDKVVALLITEPLVVHRNDQ